MINIGTKFLLSLCRQVVLFQFCGITGSTWRWGRTEILLLTEWPAARNALDTRSWFRAVFTYCDCGSWPHTFTLGLCWGKWRTRRCICCGRVGLNMWNWLRVKERS